jgi:hypothetical protein
VNKQEKHWYEGKITFCLGRSRDAHDLVVVLDRDFLADGGVMTKDMEICDECETVAHCAKHGCIPKQPLGCVNHDCAKCKERPAPVQEPFMWVCNSLDETEWETSKHKECEHCIPLYTTPPAQRQWVGLTDEEVNYQWTVWRASLPRYAGFAKAIEAKLRSKNNG